MEKEEALNRIAIAFNINKAEILALFEKKEKQPTRKGGVESEKKDGKNKRPTNLSSFKKRNIPPLKKFIFTEKDMLLLNKKMDEVHREIERLGDEIGKSCDGTETFHDNFDYEECGRQQKMWINHLKNLQKIKENSKVVEIEKSNKTTVGIGSIVKIEKEDGTVITKRIGSYICFLKDDISYNSPLGKLLIGKRVGEIIILDKRTGKQTILEIAPGY
ncbi:MAG: GreA/GreB family elongation factor [Patescibacteria group bacterium]|nr:GreA/GreB family elongation factor [Patescibacteria group bacterium]